MTGYAQFAADIDKEYNAFLVEEFLPFKQKIVLQALTGVVLKMPVDEGRARGNVFVSLRRLGSKTLKGSDKTGSRTIAKGQAIALSDKDPFSIVYVYNNLPYVERLENGYSDQSPEGMFALTAAEIEAQFK